MAAIRKLDCCNSLPKKSGSMKKLKNKNKNKKPSFCTTM
jgi:hypothetical protein